MALTGNYRINALHAIAGAVAFNMVQPFISIFAIRLGATDLQLGYLSSWPNLVGIVAVLGGAALVRRTPDKQRAIALMFLLGRLAFLGLAAVPFWSEQARLWALVGFWVLAISPQSAANTALQSYLADVFPQNERQAVFAARSTYSTLAGMLAGLATGWALDALPYPTGYQWIFFAATVVALAEIGLFMRLKEPQAAAASKGGEDGPERTWRQWGALMMGENRYLRYVLVSLVFHFTWQMAWPVFARYQVSVLNADNTWTSIVTVANSIGAVLAYPIWARYATRYGNLSMFRWAALSLAAAPVLTALSPSMLVLAVVNFFTGMGVAGTLLLVLQSLLERSPQEDRPVYLAVHQALISISGAIAPLAGAALMSFFDVRGALYASAALRVGSGLVVMWLYHVERNAQRVAGIGRHQSEQM